MAVQVGRGLACTHCRSRRSPSLQPCHLFHFSSPSHQVGTLAGPADAALDDGVESGKFSNGPAPTTATSLADSIVATLSQFTNSTSKSIREWMVVVPANSSEAADTKAADTKGKTAPDTGAPCSYLFANYDWEGEEVGGMGYMGMRVRSGN